MSNFAAFLWFLKYYLSLTFSRSMIIISPIIALFGYLFTICALHVINKIVIYYYYINKKFIKQKTNVEFLHTINRSYAQDAKAFFHYVSSNFT